MNCKEFRDKVVDLFDITVDMKTHAECKAHMAECPECKAYYEELAEAFNELQPRDTVAQTTQSKTPAAKTRRLHMWRPVAAAAIFIIGFITGWSHFFSTPAVAETPRSQMFENGIYSVQNVGSFQMTVFARTTPKENFAHFDSNADFVKIDINLLRQNDSVFYRVEKEGGRTIVCDGGTQYMWVPGAIHSKGSRDKNFLENFTNLLYPERILAMQKSAIDFSSKNKVTRTETDSTVILTFEGTEKNHDLQELLKTGKMGDCKVEVENVFSKNDGLLRFVKLWVEHNGKKILLLHIDDIRYNVMMSRTTMLQKPESEWTDVVNTANASSTSNLSELQSEAPIHAAKRILKAIISGKTDKDADALVYYKETLPTLTKNMEGCKATNFVVRNSKIYAGTIVFYTLIRPDGTEQQRHIAIRNDNEQHIWILDGGM